MKKQYNAVLASSVLSLIALCGLFASTQSARAVTITLNGTLYDVTATSPPSPLNTVTFNDIAGLLMSQPWWGNQSLALSAATQVGTQLPGPGFFGYAGGGFGPFFVFSDPNIIPTSNTYVYYAGGSNPGVSTVDLTPDYAWVFATATPHVPDDGPTLALLLMLIPALVVTTRRFKPGAA